MVMDYFVGRVYPYTLPLTITCKHLEDGSAKSMLLQARKKLKSRNLRLGLIRYRKNNPVPSH